MRLLLPLIILTTLVGKPFPQWKEGELHIHVINSARGECSFFLLPDGTSLVVDAGVAPVSGKYASVNPRPDAKTPPAQVYADYIRHFLPSVCRDSVDCFLLTHYHGDHMDAIPELYARAPFRRLIDRSYPDYSDGIKVGGTTKGLKWYDEFVREKTAEGLKSERFECGSDSQIGLRYKRLKNFRIRNYAANGYVWDGKKTFFCHSARENGMSCAFLLSYGPFDYWTSGDANDMSIVKATARSVGREVEAAKCFHHMSNPKQLYAENDILHPQVMITQSFYIRDIQPHQEVIERLGDSQDLFFTNIDPSLTDSLPQVYSKCKAIGGHFVIRVLKGGKKFYVYQLDDKSPDYTIKAIFGPYRSR